MARSAFMSSGYRANRQCASLDSRAALAPNCGAEIACPAGKGRVGRGGSARRQRSSGWSALDAAAEGERVGLELVGAEQDRATRPIYRDDRPRNGSTFLSVLLDMGGTNAVSVPVGSLAGPGGLLHRAIRAGRCLPLLRLWRLRLPGRQPSRLPWRVGRRLAWLGSARSAWQAAAGAAPAAPAWCTTWCASWPSVGRTAAGQTTWSPGFGRAARSAAGPRGACWRWARSAAGRVSRRAPRRADRRSRQAPW
jgi:hypothetical protein